MINELVVNCGVDGNCVILFVFAAKTIGTFKMKKFKFRLTNRILENLYYSTFDRLFFLVLRFLGILKPGVGA